MSRAVWLAWLAACAGVEGTGDTSSSTDDATDGGDGSDPDDTEPDGGEEGMLQSTTSSERTDNSGRIVVEVEVDDDITAFLVTAVADDTQERLALESITGPDGERVVGAGDWLFSGETLTGSFIPSGPVVASQWPIRQEDGPLVPGTYEVELSSLDDGVPVEVTTLTKTDDDFTAGVVDVQIVWAQGVQNEPGVEDAVATAVERWRTIWADQGVELRETYLTSAIDPDLAFFTAGSRGIELTAEEGTGHSLQVIIGETVAGQQSLYGVAAGIPGTPIPTEHTFVLVSWLTHAGFDGEFDSYEEKRILGETLAHELGHYMGLPHPVEVGWDFYDALEDTDQCGSMGTCQGSLGDNLMFPYPVCSGYATDCTQQGVITQDQKRVLHQYLATL